MPIRYYALFDCNAAVGDDGIRWTNIGGGKIAARAMPKGFDVILSWNATIVVSLCEEGTTGIAKAIAQSDGNLRSLILPLEPFSNCRKGISDRDMDCFRQADSVLQLLRDGERVVVHCAAGCHRTGSFIYVVLRRAGLSPDEALEGIKQTRHVTWDEMTKVTKKRPGGLKVKAEEAFQRLHAPQA